MEGPPLDDRGGRWSATAGLAANRFWDLLRLLPLKPTAMTESVSPRPLVGVLALQGDFDAHRKAIEAAGGTAAEVRTEQELNACDGLIIPGGESTTMWKLLEMERLADPLRTFAASKPVFGTCAGAILLAHKIANPQDLGAGVQQSLDLMDIDVERNAYGRQIDSHVARLQLLEDAADPRSGQAMGSGNAIEAVFIRAPIIRRIGEGCQVLARHKGDPVWVQQGRHMVTTFHPELSRSTGVPAVHGRFLDVIRGLQ